MLRNLVKETATAIGTGTSISLAGAASGYLSFVSAFGSGNLAWYFITDGTQTEAQAGIITAGSPNVLARGTPVWTSTGSASRLNFTGACTIYCSLPADRTLYADNAAVWQAQTRRLTALADGTGLTDAATLNQVAWRLVQQQVSGTAVSGFIFALPATFNRFRLEWQDFLPTASRQVYMRLSLDGGATYTAGASDYIYAAQTDGTASVAASGGSGSFVPLSNATTINNFGMLEFAATGSKYFLGDTAQYSTVPAIQRYGVGGNCTVAGTASHILIGISGTTVAAGRARLTGGL